jgi:mevalonate kinase
MPIYQRKANGKFLLTAEYAVLDGARALALPLQRGQTMRVLPATTAYIYWQAFDQNGQLWLTAILSVSDLSLLESSDHDLGLRLRQILVAAKAINPTFLSGAIGYEVSTSIDFDRNWGLGTSSSLIALVADWAQVNAYQLLEASFGGSGYDIACAFTDHAIFYSRRIEHTHKPTIERVHYQPPRDAQCYFVYLNQKQNSRDAIQAYRKTQSTASFIDEVSDLSQAFFGAGNLAELQKTMTEHEQVLAARLDQIPVQALYFKQFPGVVKSLGAWGGDFVLAACQMEKNEMREWCNSNGFPLFFSYDDLALDSVL